MAFRGFGDDALKVRADKREAALKAAQIAASERASMRAANLQMAGLQENARQADMANQLAREQLAAGNERFAKQLAAGEAARMDELGLKRAGMELQASELALKREAMAADEAYRRDSLAATEAARKDDLSVKIAEMSLRERQLQLNERTAARLDAEWQRQQAAQEELQREDTATQLAVIRAASLSSGPLGMPYINALNDLRGVAYGDPGSTTQVFPVIDPQTGARLGIGTVKIGEDGKEIQSILDPAIILPQVRKSMTPEKWEEYARQLIGANTAKGSDRMTVAAIREMQKAKLEFAKSDPASLVKTLAEQEDTLRVTKPAKTGAGKAADPANQENLDRIRRIKTNVLKEMERQTAGEEEATPAPTLSPEQKKFMEKPGAAAGTGEEIDKRALVEQARREAKGDKAKAFELYKAALAKAQGGNEEGVLEEVSRGKSELVQKEDSAPVVKKEATEAAALSNKEETSSLTYGPRIKEEAAKPTKFGPEEGTEEYLRDMPKGKAAEPTAKDVSSSRKEILARLEKAYRLPKSPDKEEKVRKIKAELDAFNKIHKP